ncbi:MAG: hypothetical protein D6726_05065 [Nitrospirae bacterium]|nr:MAG: hypothetical protein D6726_05065 [Nitrospirota bacterium]
MGKIKALIVALCLVLVSLGVAYADEKGQNTAKITPEERKCIEYFIEFRVNAWSINTKIHEAYSSLIESGRYSACDIKKIIEDYLTKK